MKVKYFTYFDQNYAGRGCVMIESLLPYCQPGDEIVVLALDQDTKRLTEIFFKDPVRTVELQDLNDRELLAVKEVREHREFCWSCAAAMSDWMVRNSQDGEYLVYMDSDMMFFRDPHVLLEELNNGGSVLIHEHRFSPDRMAWLPASGRFNVGFVGFRVCDETRKCVERWRAQVIESCERDEEKGLCGDQGYLNEWPNLYPNLRVMQNIGGGVAPWNVNQYRVSHNNEGPTVDDTPVVFYHYHSLKTLYDPKLDFIEVQPAYGYEFSNETHEEFYRPYATRLRRITTRASRVGFAVRADKLIEPNSDPDIRYRPGNKYQFQAVTLGVVLRTIAGVPPKAPLPASAGASTDAKPGAPLDKSKLLGFEFPPKNLDSVVWPFVQRVRSRAKGTRAERQVEAVLARAKRVNDRLKSGGSVKDEIGRGFRGVINVRGRVKSLGYAIARSSEWGAPKDVLDLSGDRDVEWCWTVAHIPNEPGRVLDLGPATSTTPFVPSFTATEVIALDIDPPKNMSMVSPKLTYVKGDILHGGLPPGNFDTIINCSTTEHIGLSGRYGSTEDPEGDLKAMALMRERLSGPHARMVFTIPVGVDSVERPYHRIYGAKRLPLVLSGYKVLKEMYYAKPGLPNQWRPVSKDVALSIKGSSSFYSLGLFVLARQ